MQQNKTVRSEPSYLSLREASSYLRVSRLTIRKAIEQGEISAFRVGVRRLALQRSDLDAWLHGFRVKPENRPGSQEGARK